VLAFSDIIDFLLRLLSDEATRVQFDQDPQGTLARAGLQGVTGQDIRDARLQLADSGAVSATDDAAGARYPHGDDPVHEIGYTTAHYAAHEDMHHEAAHHADTGGSNTFLTVDDRDTLFFQSISDDDITVTDNSVHVTDSFDEDNSQVTAVQVKDSFNSDDDTSIDAQNSFNTDDDVVAIQNQGGDGDIDVGIDNPPDTSDPDPVDAEPDEPQPVDLEDTPADPVDDADAGEEPADAVDDSDPLAG
jgi:hypothetical protein